MSCSLSSSIGSLMKIFSMFRSWFQLLLIMGNGSLMLLGSRAGASNFFGVGSVDGD